MGLLVRAYGSREDRLGPAYTGPVTVIGSDVYDLDSDSDGTACE
jgi:hypothetical protein